MLEDDPKTGRGLTLALLQVLVQVVACGNTRLGSHARVRRAGDAMMKTDKKWQNQREIRRTSVVGVLLVCGRERTWTGILLRVASIQTSNQKTIFLPLYQKCRECDTITVVKAQEWD